MGNYNPNYPTVAGNEFAPLVVDTVNLDTATMLGYTYLSEAKEDIYTARVVSAEPPSGQTQRKSVLVEVYYDDYAPGTGPLRKIVIPVSGGTLGTNAAYGGGGATIPGVLGNPGDGQYIAQVGPNSWTRVVFDTKAVKVASLLAGTRIVDVTVRYALSGPFDVIASAMTMSLEKPSSSIYIMDDAVSGATDHRQNVVPRRSRMGDLNPYWNNTINPNVTYPRGIWRYDAGSNGYTGLQDFAFGGLFDMRWSTTGNVPAGTEFRFHYCALEITYGQEGRVAAGGLELLGGPVLSDGLFVYDVPLNSVPSWGFPWDAVEGYPYMIAVGQGLCGNNSASNPVPLPVTRLSPGPDVFRGHKGVVLHKTLRSGEEWTREETPDVPVVVPFASTTTFNATTIYNPAQVYNGQLVLDVSQSTTASTVMPEPPSFLTYNQIRFWARCLPGTTDPLTLGLSRGVNNLNITASIQRDAFELLPEVTQGWKRVTLDLSAPYQPVTNSSIGVAFTSATDPSNPWQVLGADSNPTTFDPSAYAGATYRGINAYTNSNGIFDYGADATVMLVQAMPVPAGLTVTADVQPLDVMDEYCGQPLEAIPTGIRYHQVSWTAVNAVAVAGFAFYEVQRRDTTMAPGEWETVAEITYVGVAAMDDYEARVGVTSTYRVRTVHVDGYTSAWSGQASGMVAAPGVTGVGVEESVLILTSNHNPSGNLAYVQTWEGGTVPTQDFTYAEGSQTAMQSMYGRDYSVAFRPLERGGVEFTRTLLVNAVGVPVETLDRGVTALRDLAWSTVPSVCVRDEQSNRWLTTVAVPASAHRDIPRRGHLVLATATFTEVSATPAPVDYTPPCEGLRLENRAYRQLTRTAAAPAALTGTRVLTDSFSRTVGGDSWGAAQTGQAYTKMSGGATSVLSVTGSVGQVVSGTAGTETRIQAALPVNHYRMRVKVTLPALATGSYYETGILLRYRDDNNYYRFALRSDTTNQYGFSLSKVVGGVRTALWAYVAAGAVAAGNSFWLEVMVQGVSIRVRGFKDGAVIPTWGDETNFTTSDFDTSVPVTNVTTVGLFQERTSTNTNANLTVQYDNLIVDTVPKTLDLRALVRPYTDSPRLDLGTAFTSTAEPWNGYGEWHFFLNPLTLETFIAGAGSNRIVSRRNQDAGIVRNRLIWIRVLIEDNVVADGTRYTTFYTSLDGVNWVYLEQYQTTPFSEPLPVLAADQPLWIYNYDPGGVWLHRYEVRADNVLLASPDFAAQSPGTTQFNDAQGNQWLLPMTGGLCGGVE